LIRKADRADADRVHAFHVGHLTPHLWPRTEGELSDMAKDGRLHFAEAAGDVCGVCYVWTEDGDPEFGGVCVHADARGTGVSDVLGAVAVAVYVATNVPSSSSKLIAHVHSRNTHPQKLLGRLGFRLVSTVRVPPKLVPPGMDKDPDGSIEGQVYEYDFRKLVDVASKIEGALAAKADFSLNAGALPWADILDAIRDIAGRF
jgi:hypothetical protein